MKKIIGSLVVILLLTWHSSHAQFGVGTSTPKSTLDVYGSFGMKVDTITSNTTLDASYGIVICRNSSAITITLPSSATSKGRIYYIKKASTGNVTIAPSLLQTIDGSLSFLLNTNNQMVNIIADGNSKWMITQNAVASATSLASNTLTSATNTLSSTVNGVLGTASMVNSISNSSASNTLTTTVNGVAATGVNIINSNALNTSSNGITSTVNGVSSTLTPVSGTVSTSSYLGFDASGNLVKGSIPSSTNTLSSSTNTITSTVNGVAATASAVNSNTLTAASSALTSTVNGVASTLTPSAGTIGASNYLGFDASGNLVKGAMATPTTTNTIGLSGNTLTSTVNGVAATSNAVGTVSNTSSGNTLTTTVNGVAGTAVPMVNSVSNTSSTNTLTTTVNGVAGTAVNIINTNATSLSGSNLTTTVNGVSATALDLSPAITSKAWSLTGNSGTTYASNFLGTTDNKSLRFRTNNTARMIIDSIGNVGIGTTTPAYALEVSAASNPLKLTGLQSGASADSVMTINSSNIIKKRTVANLLSNGTTHTMSSATNTITSTVNGVSATAPAVNSVSNTSSANNLSTTVNGVAGSNVSIINTNALSSSTNTLTSTVNGIASSGATIINSNALTAAASALTSTVNGVASTLTPTAGTIGTSTYLGFDASGNLVKGATPAPTITHTLALSTNTLTSTVNGVAATSNAVGSVSNNSSANSLSTTVNGVAGTAVNIINSNATSLSGTNLTTTVNGVAATALDLTPAITSKAWSLTGNSGTSYATNFIGTTDNVSMRFKTNNTARMIIDSTGNVGIGTTTAGSKLDVKGTLRLSGSTSGYVGLQPAAAAGSTTYTLPSADGSNGQFLSTNGGGTLSWGTPTTTHTMSSSVNTITSTVNGVSATAPAVNSVSNTSSANNLSTTVNGVTGSNVSIINTNALSSSTNTLTSTVNGIASSGVNIINTNATSLSGANLTTTVNGVASTALDLTPAITSKAWSLTGNSGTTAGTNFVGTTDAIDFVTKTNNTEKMRVTSAGKIGIGGVTSPTYDVSLIGTAAKTLGVERNTTAATAGSGLTINAGGAYSGGTNLAGGDLTISAGTATGNGTSNIYLKTAGNGSTGTTDATPTTAMTIAGSSKVGIGTTSPTNQLHVYAAANPLRIEGLQASSSTADKVLVADATGVIKTAISSSSNFAGYLNANLTTSGTTINKVTVQTELYDAGTEYTTSTGYFNPAVSGTYEYEIEVTVSNSSATSSDYGTSTDKCMVGLVNASGSFVSYQTFENSVDPRSYFFKGIVTLTAGTNYYFGIQNPTGSTVINYYPTGSTGSGIGTYFSIQRIN